ncbi:MAG: hypothetical protein MJZ34_13375 [Paludibacteraceae bacterium]|nr:hypothetical protein [Paludibacteraceae bacterium]
MNEISRKELIEKICLTDATYDCGQGDCSSSCSKCDDVLNYLLDRYDKQIMSDAIEEFLLKAKEKKYHSNITRENCVAIAELDWIAEQLKQNIK